MDGLNNTKVTFVVGEANQIRECVITNATDWRVDGGVMLNVGSADEIVFSCPMHRLVCVERTNEAPKPMEMLREHDRRTQ